MMKVKTARADWQTDCQFCWTTDKILVKLHDRNKTKINVNLLNVYSPYTVKLWKFGFVFTQHIP